MSDEKKNLHQEQRAIPEPEAAPGAAAEAQAADGATADDEALEFDVADYLEQYKALSADLEQTKDALAESAARLLRLQADFDNYRRRQREQSEELIKNAAAGMVEALLPVVDNFERALAAMADSPDKAGVELIARQLTQILSSAGLAEIEALGAPFDPNLHQAVAQEEVKNAEKGKVTAVLLKGYTFNGKLLRASMVQVGM